MLVAQVCVARLKVSGFPILPVLLVPPAKLCSGTATVGKAAVLMALFPGSRGPPHQKSSRLLGYHAEEESAFAATKRPWHHHQLH